MPAIKIKDAAADFLSKKRVAVTGVSRQPQNRVPPEQHAR